MECLLVTNVQSQQIFGTQPPCKTNTCCLLSLRSAATWISIFFKSLDRASLNVSPCFQSLCYATLIYSVIFTVQIWQLKNYSFKAKRKWSPVLWGYKRFKKPSLVPHYHTVSGSVLRGTVQFYSYEWNASLQITKTHTENSYRFKPVIITADLLQLHISTLETMLIAKCK